MLQQSLIWLITSILIHCCQEQLTPPRTCPPSEYMQSQNYPFHWQWQWQIEMNRDQLTSKTCTVNNNICHHIHSTISAIMCDVIAICYILRTLSARPHNTKTKQILMTSIDLLRNKATFSQTKSYITLPLPGVLLREVQVAKLARSINKVALTNVITWQITLKTSQNDRNTMLLNVRSISETFITWTICKIKPWGKTLVKDM